MGKKRHAIVGGLHATKELALLDGFEVICCGHCTKESEAIASCFGARYEQISVGYTLEL